MNSNETVLRTLCAQVQLELAPAAAALSNATAIAERARRLVGEALRSCEHAANELRNAMWGARINPALLTAMQRRYAGEQAVLRSCRRELDSAERLEQQARAAYAELRNRERSLGRAIASEHREQRLRAEAKDVARADDMWLQHAAKRAP